MELTDKFDQAITKQALAANPALTLGYVPEAPHRAEPYNVYLSNCAWADFQAKMRDNHRKMYEEGAGSELEERKHRSGVWMPPKMASLGSSSCMAYLMFRDVEGAEFEKQLPNGIGRSYPHLDVFMERENEIIFVEAKCREIYSKPEVLISKKYRKYLDCAGINAVEHDEKLKILAGTTYFDVKQTITHLVGIANYAASHPDSKKITFVDLFYNPSEIAAHYWESEQDRDDAKERYKDVIAEARHCDIKAWFYAILKKIVSEATCEFRHEIHSQALIGPFFWHNGKLLSAHVSSAAGELQADKRDYRLEHTQFAQQLHIGDYLNIPRGRVVWDTTNNKAIVYIDKCIAETAEAVEALKAEFCLGDDYQLEYDLHYRCPKCLRGQPL